MTKKIIDNINLDYFKTSIRDFNGVKIALYKSEDGGAVVISQTPEGNWIISESISVNDVLKSPPWIEDE